MAEDRNPLQTHSRSTYIHDITNQNNDHTIKDFLNRKVLVGEFPINTTDAELTVICEVDPVHELLNQRNFRNKLDTFMGFVGDCELTAYVNPQPMTQGLLILFSYYGKDEDLARYTQIVSQKISLTGLPHITMNVASTPVGSLTVPFVSNYLFANLTEEGRGIYPKFYLAVYSQMKNSDAAVTTVSLFLQFKEPQPLVITTKPLLATSLHIKRAEQLLAKKWLHKETVFTKQGGTSKEAKNVQKTGRLNQISDGIASIGSALPDIPLLSEVKTAANWTSGILGTIGQLTGWAKILPRDNTSPSSLHTNRQMHNIDGSAMGIYMGANSEGELARVPRGESDMDELAIQNFTKRFVFLTSFNVKAADSQGQILFKQDVSPLVFQEVSGQIFFSPLGFAGQFFSSWTGDIAYRFHVVKSNFQNCKFSIHYLPGVNASTVTTADDLFVTQGELWDTASSTEFTYVVPYVSDVPWKFLIKPDVGVGNPNIFTTGCIVLELQNRLQFNSGAVDNIDVVVEVAAGDNFKFNNLNQTPYTVALGTPIPSALQREETVFTKQGFGGPDQLGTTSEITSPTDTNLYGTNTTDKLWLNSHIHGDNISSLSSIMRRASLFARYSPAVNHGLTVFPYRLLTQYDSTSSVCSNLDIISSPFVFYSGNVLLNIFRRGTIPVDFGVQKIISRSDPADYITSMSSAIPPLRVLGTDEPTTYGYSENLQQFNFENTCNILVPNYNNSLMSKVSDASYLSSTDRQIFQNKTPPNFISYFPPDVSTSKQYDVYISAHDNYQCFLYNGIPPMTLRTEA